MKAFLLHKDRDFNLDGTIPRNSDALTRDLELSVLIDAMALGDKFLYEVARRVTLRTLTNEVEIIYRQNIVRDVIANSILIRQLYDISIEAIENEKRTYFGLMIHSPTSVLSRSVVVLRMLVAALRQLRGVGTYNAKRFSSEGFKTLFEMLDRELSDEYFARIEDHLKRLEYQGGVLVSAELGESNKGVNYTLRKPKDKTGNWIAQLMKPKPESYTIHLQPRDESGANALAQLRDRGVNLVANAVAQSNEHILGFFRMLRTELAFYVGCLNLHERLSKLHVPVTFPELEAASERALEFNGLYDVCLALKIGNEIVGNEMNADGKHVLIITGANQGGKTTFLRSVGLAQLMMQCGMFVPAASFSANICSGVFTHYKREEDRTMKSGKLDEELSRLNDFVDDIAPNAIILFNESFAATNEREGSEIARQICSALVERRVKVFFVTHLYDFAHSLYLSNDVTTLFLRSERQANGGRTFKLIEGEPLQTGFGEDLYNQIFGGDVVRKTEIHVAG
jgi:hypothetical protein